MLAATAIACVTAFVSQANAQAFYFGGYYENGPDSPTTAGSWCCGTKATLQNLNPIPDQPDGTHTVQAVLAASNLNNHDVQLQVGVLQYAGQHEATCHDLTFQYFVEQIDINNIGTCYWIGNASAGASHRYQVSRSDMSPSGHWTAYIDGTARGPGGVLTGAVAEAVTATAEIEYSDAGGAPYTWGFYGGSGNDSLGNPRIPWTVSNGAAWFTVTSATKCNGTAIFYDCSGGPFSIDGIGTYMNGWRIHD